MDFGTPERADARLPASARLLGALLLIAAVAGCANSNTTLRSDASHVFNPSLSVAFGIDDDSHAPAEPHTGHAIQIEVMTAKGGGAQTLAPGQNPVVFGATTFNAPQQLTNDFDLTFADVSYRWRKFFGESRFGLELTGGLAFSSLSLTASSATQRASLQFADFMPKGSIAFIWRMRPSTSLHVRTTGFRSPMLFAAPYSGVSSGGRYEIFLAQALGNNVALRMGYAHWELHGSTGDQSSDFYANFSGPTLDLGFNF